MYEARSLFWICCLGVNAEEKTTLAQIERKEFTFCFRLYAIRIARNTVVLLWSL